MSAALRALRAAQSEREQSELRVAAARQNVDEHRRRSIVAPGVPVDAESLRWAHGYRVRLDEALVAEQQRCAALVEAERQAEQSVERARVALAECKGKVEVVQKRIDQAVKAQHNKAEAQAEESPQTAAVHAERASSTRYGNGVADREASDAIPTRPRS